MRRISLVLLAVLSASCVPVQRLDSMQRRSQEEHLVKLLVRGIAATERRDLDEAEAAFQLAREVKPGDPRAYDGLGCVALVRGELELAEYFFKKALGVDSLYDRAYVHLATLAMIRGDVNTAEELLEIAIQLNPVNYRARNNLAALLINTRRDSKRAREELLKAAHLQRLPDAVVAGNIELERRLAKTP